MATRSRTVWKPRSDGQFDCRVGWKINSSGKREQHRFRLGTDLKEAKRRDQLLRQMWERLEELAGGDAVWGDDALKVAKLVAKGRTHVQVPRNTNEEVVPYAQRVHRLRTTFSMLAIIPEPEYGYALGVQLLEALETSYTEAEQSVESQRESDAMAFTRRLTSVPETPMAASGPTMHEAMRDYIEWLKEEYSHPESGVTPWGRTQVGQVESLIAHHNDLGIAELGHEQIENMTRYWRQRPYKKGTKGKKQRVSAKSATHYISALRNFLKWLHTRPNFAWKKPDGFHDIKTRVTQLEHESRTQVDANQVFTLDELVLLYKYAVPLERILILLGLNCGFGAAESSSLLIGEVFLRSSHSARHRELLNFNSSPNDSFIRRIRRKNRVYGEFLLFQQTVRAIESVLRLRKSHEDFSPNSKLLVNSRGHAFDKPTKSGNANRQIPNRFVRLVERIGEDGHQIQKLPFKMLRKTGGDLVKRFSDGEVAGVFLCHGNPVTSDDLSDAYTQRPFGKVFNALREVEIWLAPMFEAGGEKPFDE